MNTMTQHYAARQQATVDSLVAAQGAVFAGFEKLVDLNLKAARATLDAAAERSRQVAAVKDPREAVALTASLAQPSAEKALAYGKQVFDIVAGVQADLGKLAESQIAEGRAQFGDALEQWSKNAPSGSEGAVAVLKSSLASANSAYESLTRAVKQAADVAETNLNAAAQATLKAASDVAEASGIAAAPRAANSRRAAAAAA